MDATPREFLTVARLAGRIGATPIDLRNAAKRAGVQPGLIIDGLPLFDIRDVDAIAGAICNPIVPTKVKP